MSTRVHEVGRTWLGAGRLVRRKESGMNFEVYRNVAFENGLIECVDKPQRVGMSCTAAAFYEQCAADFFSDGACL